jgi:ribosome biogenesis GTPase
MSLKKGQIIKLTGGLYTVIDEDGVKKQVKPLGIFRYQDIKPKVGDWVAVDDHSITQVFARKNDLSRPAIANIDQALIIQSAKEPDFSFGLLDRFLVIVADANIDAVIIVTKIDLCSVQDRQELAKNMAFYEEFYPVIWFSTKTYEGQEKIESLTQSKINVVTGQTGAGKSSLLNVLNPKLQLATNQISKALGRGKHTTRTVELIPFFHGWIADTPGFSQLDITNIEQSRLRDLFPDFLPYASHCRFNGCSHIHEPECQVRNAVDEGKILKSRYENYVNFHEEIRSTKPRY